MKKLSPLLFLCIVHCSKAQVAPNIDWMQNYSGTSSASFVTIANALDAWNNAHVVGYAYNGVNKDLKVLKYDSLGNLLWQATYNNGGDDVGNAITYDAAGNVYVTGKSYGTATTLDDYVTIKYNASGVVQWTKRLNAVNGDDEAKDIKVDGAGNVFVTGTCYRGTGPKNDIGTVKYLANGTQTWVAYYNGAGFDDAGVGLVLSANGNSVYVAGNRGTGTATTNIVAQALNSANGSANWTYTVSGTGSNSDESKAIIRSGSNVVLCGFVDNTTTGTDYTTIKLNGSNGAQIFKSDYDFASDINFATDLVKDSTGNIAIVGKAKNGSYYEYHTVLYDSTGSQLWVNKESTQSGSGFVEPKIACDTIAHHFYCVGEKLNATNDIFLYQITPGGNTSWRKSINGSANNFDFGLNLSVNGIGEVYVSALTTNTVSGYDITTIKIGQTPVYFPPDLTPGQNPSVGYLYLENKGQIVKAGTDSIEKSVMFSCTETYPYAFFGVNRFSYRFFHFDTLAGGGRIDTVQRIDINHYRSNTLTECYPLQPKHGMHSYMQERLQDAIVGVQGYERFMIPNIYPYTDLHYYSNDNGLKMYYVLKPFANPANIQWDIQGATTTTINGGNLEIKGFNGQVQFVHPVIYTVDMNGAPQTVTATASWTTVASRYAIKINGTYNTSMPLIVQLAYSNATVAANPADDNIQFCTYYGGVSNEGVKAIDVDPKTGKYVTVFETWTSEFTPQFPIQTGSLVSITTNTQPGSNYLGIVLFDKDANRLATNTYGLWGYSMSPQNVVLNGNKITVVGNNAADPVLQTTFAPLPLYNSTSSLTAGTYTSNRGHGYVIQFNYNQINNNTASINNILWATRLNGYAGDIARTPDGKNLYISASFYANMGADTKTLSGAYNDANYNVQFYNFRIAKFDSLGVRQWATVFDANNTNFRKVIDQNKLNSGTVQNFYYDDYLKCEIACDNNGFSIAGETDTIGLKVYSKYGVPTYSVHRGRIDGFYARFNKKDSLVYSSYVGGMEDEAYTDITSIDGMETAMIGYSSSQNMNRICTPPGAGAYSDTVMYYGGWVKMLVTKIDTTGAKTWSTFVGDDVGRIYGWGISADNNGKLFLSGRTNETINGYKIIASNPPGVYNSIYVDDNESYMYGFNKANSPGWNTTFGGWRSDIGMAVACNTVNGIVITGGVTKSKATGWPGLPSYFPVRKHLTNPNAYHQDHLASQAYPGGAFVDTNDGYLAGFYTVKVVGIREYFRDKANLEAFILFPNPTDNYTSIAFKDGMKGGTKIEVYNQMGQLLHLEFRKEILPQTIVDLNTSNLATGCYLVTVTNEGVKQTKKLIISK